MVVFREYYIRKIGRFSRNLPKGTQIVDVDRDPHDEDAHFLALVEEEEEEKEKREFIAVTRCDSWSPDERFTFNKVRRMENIKYIGHSSYRMLYKTAKIYLFELV